LAELTSSVREPGWTRKAKAFEAALRSSRDLSRDERDSLWGEYQRAWDAFKEHQQERERLAHDQHAGLSRCLDDLEAVLESREFKEVADRFQADLRESRALFKKQRDDLWSRYQGLWKQRKRLRERDANDSDLARRQYVQRLYGLDFSYDGAPIMQSFSNWERVGHKVRATREQLKAMQREVKQDARLLGRDRKAVFDEIQDVWFKVSQAEETTFHVHGERAAQLYNEAYAAVDNMAPGAAAAVLKANGAEIRSLWLSRADRANYKQWFDELWQRLRYKREEAHAAWRDRQEAGLEKLLGARDRLLDALDRVRSNNRLNESKLADAWSDGYRDRVSEWLREGEERERDMERSLDELESKIRDARDRLRG
ncbi:MAG: hypothetical protein KC766_00100, partial [Myxococcales bacterium]|nr:hypothetical protein [Myxococcales bacterium]